MTDNGDDEKDDDGSKPPSSGSRSYRGSDGGGLLDLLKASCDAKGVNLASSRPETNHQVVIEEVDRALKMFYLHMKMSGFLKEYKEDYFV